MPRGPPPSCEAVVSCISLVLSVPEMYPSASSCWIKLGVDKPGLVSGEGAPEELKRADGAIQ